MRAIIPIPLAPTPGKVHLAVTICTASATDPEHPLSDSGNRIEVIFRPHIAKFTKGKDGGASGSGAAKQP
jgi:hypothetical protein